MLLLVLDALNEIHKDKFHRLHLRSRATQEILSSELSYVQQLETIMKVITACNLHKLAFLFLLLFSFCHVHTSVPYVYSYLLVYTHTVCSWTSNYQTLLVLCVHINFRNFLYFQKYFLKTGHDNCYGYYVYMYVYR